VCAGDYRECSVVLWSMYTYTVLTSTKTSQPIHDLKWDPYTVNEFASVGDAGTLSFWLLDETQAEVMLSVHEARLPDDLLGTHHMVGISCLPSSAVFIPYALWLELFPIWGKIFLCDLIRFSSADHFCDLVQFDLIV